TTNVPSNVCFATSGVHILNGTITHFGQAVSICVPGTPGGVSTNAHIHNLTLTGNIVGLALFGANDNSIHNNTIVNNTEIQLNPLLLAGFGIQVQGSSGNTIKNNELTGNATDGIAL